GPRAPGGPVRGPGSPLGAPRRRLAGRAGAADRSGAGCPGRRDGAGPDGRGEPSAWRDDRPASPVARRPPGARQLRARDHFVRGACGVAAGPLSGPPRPGPTPRAPPGHRGGGPARPLAFAAAHRPPAPIASLARYEAIALFVDRLLDVRPTFQLTGENAPTIVQICQGLDG